MIKKQGQFDSSSLVDNSINDQVLKVSKVINKAIFEVEIKMDGYTEYTESGLITYVKDPKVIEYKSIEEYFKQVTKYSML